MKHRHHWLSGLWAMILLLGISTPASWAQGETKMSESKTNELVELMSKLDPLLRNGWRSIQEYDNSDTSTDTLLWSPERSAREAVALLKPQLEQRTMWAKETDIKEVIYQMNVRRLVLPVDTDNAYNLLTSALMMLSSVYPEARTLLQEELDKALEAQLYPEALELLEFELERAEGADEYSKLLHQYTSRFGSTDEALLLQMFQLRTQYHEEVFPLELLLFTEEVTPEDDRAYIAKRTPIEEVYNTRIKPKLATNAYKERIEGLASEVFKDQIVQITSKDLNLTTGDIVLEVTGILTSPSKITRSTGYNDKAGTLIKEYPVTQLTIVRDEVRDQLPPAAGDYIYQSLRLSDSDNAFGAMAHVNTDKLRTIFSIGEQRGAIRIVSAVDGAPVRGVKVVKLGGSNNVLSTYFTNGDGVVVLPRESASYRVRVEDERFASAPSYYVGRAPGPRKQYDTVGITYYTDRPIYRRGQTVEVGIVSHEVKDGQHLLHPGLSGEIELKARRDGGEEEVLQTVTFTTNANAVTEVEFLLPNDAALSNFRLESELGTQYLLVEDYKLNHLSVVVDSIPSGYVYGRPLIIHGRTVDMNGLATPAQLVLEYEGGKRIEDSSGMDGLFKLVTPPLEERRQKDNRHRGYWWRGDKVEIRANDALGNVAVDTRYLRRQETHLKLSATSAVEGESGRKEAFKVSLKTQPYLSMQLGDLSRYLVKVELTDKEGRTHLVGEIPADGEETFNLSHLHSGVYQLKLSAVDRYGTLVEDILHNLYLYSEKDTELYTTHPLWGAKLSDESGFLYGSAYDGIVTLEVTPEGGDTRFETHTVKAGNMNRWERAKDFVGSVQAYAFHHEHAVRMPVVFSREEEQKEDLKLVGLEELASESFLPSANFNKQITIRNSDGTPLRDAPVIVTVFDKAVLEAAITPNFWRLLTNPAVPIYDGMGGRWNLNVVEDALLGEPAMLASISEESAAAPTPMRSTAMAKEEAAAPELSMASVALRSNFAETAYFTALLVTDGEGRVTLDFQLPDTQTQYVMKLFTFSQDLESQKIFDEEFKVYSPLSIELTLPRYLVQGDVMQGSALLRNTSDTPRKAWYEILANGVSLMRGEIELPANGTTTIPFAIQAPTEGADQEIILEGKLLSDEITDGVQRRLPLLSNLSTYRVATPIMLYGETSFSQELVKSELASDKELELDLYLSPLHVVLSQLALEYERGLPVAELGPFSTTHQLVIYYQLDYMLRAYPELSTELARNAKALELVADEEKSFRFARQATAGELAKFYAFVSDEGQRTAHLKELEQKLLTYQHPSGGFRYRADMLDASPFITSYILGMLVGDAQVLHSDALKDATAGSLKFLASELQRERSYYRDFMDYALLRAQYGKVSEPLPQAIQEGLKEQAKDWRENYQRLYSPSSLIRFAEYSRYYESKEQHAEVLKFIRDRSGYTHNDVERLNLTLYLSEQESAQVHPDAMRYLLQLQQGLLWESAYSMRAISTMLRHVKPTRIAPDAALVLQGDHYLLSAEERATGRITRYFPEVPRQLSFQLEGVESDHIFGGISYTVQEPSARATATGEKLTVAKQIFARRVGENGETSLIEVSEETPARAGERLIIRYLINTEQDLSLIQLRDPRPAGAEQGYDFRGIKRADRTWYYYERREDHDRIFIDYLPRGKHVVELEATANVAGTFTYGPTTVESYYAPEYTGNSAGGRMSIRPNNNEVPDVKQVTSRFHNYTIIDQDNDMAEVKFKGNPVTTIGNLPAVGTLAPDFVGVKEDLSELRLSDLKGKRVVLNIFPSIDTGTCAMSVRQFNKLASELENTTVLCLSMDLPFAQSRFCGAEGIENVTTLSMFREPHFAKDYGVLITDSAMKGLFARSVVVLDEEGKVIYTELVEDIANEPNYEAAIKAAKE